MGMHVGSRLVGDERGDVPCIRKGSSITWTREDMCGIAITSCSGISLSSRTGANLGEFAFFIQIACKSRRGRPNSENLQ